MKWNENEAVFVFFAFLNSKHFTFSISNYISALLDELMLIKIIKLKNATSSAYRVLKFPKWIVSTRLNRSSIAYLNRYMWCVDCISWTFYEWNKIWSYQQLSLIDIWYQIFTIEQQFDVTCQCRHDNNACNGPIHDI